MTDPRVRVGVIGTGSLGYHHTRIWSALEGAQLVEIGRASCRERV